MHHNVESMGSMSPNYAHSLHGNINFKIRAMAYSKTSELIIKHLSFERTDLGFASVNHFAETGNISGKLYGRIKDMVDEALAETPDASDNTLPIDIMEEQIRKTLWKHAKPYIDEGCVIKAVNLDTKEYEVAEDLVKLHNLHFVSKRSELLIAFCRFLFTEMNYTTETDYTPEEQVEIFSKPLL